MNRADNMLAEGIRAAITRSSPAIGSNASVSGSATRLYAGIMGLAEIWAYVAAETSEVVATNFIGEIESAFEPERLFPLASPARGTLAPGLRVTHRHDKCIDMVPRQPLMVHRTMRRRPS